MRVGLGVEPLATREPELGSSELPAIKTLYAPVRARAVFYRLRSAAIDRVVFPRALCNDRWRRLGRGRGPGGRFTMKTSIATMMAVIALAGVAKAAPPTCSNPIGTWQNQIQSILTLKTYDSTTGAIAGTYTSPSGGGSIVVPLVGWMNTTKSSSKSNYKTVISFTVNWGQFGDVTAWTGTCDNTKNQITGLWHLAYTATDYDWDHVLAGEDIFNPH